MIVCKVRFHVWYALHSVHVHKLMSVCDISCAGNIIVEALLLSCIICNQDQEKK